MRVMRIGLALAIASTLVGCDKETGPFFAPQVPLAYVRFINAVPDTFSVDFRFIDQIEYTPTAILRPFRSFTSYEGASPGTRPLRVFTNPGGTFPDINVVSQTLADESVSLVAGTYYSIIISGFSRTGQTPGASLLVLEDQIPADIGTNVAVRTVNLGSGLSNVDVFAAAASGDPLPATPLFPNVGYAGVSTYTMMAPGTRHLRVTASGTTDPVLMQAAAPNGVAGDPENLLTTIGGVQQAGSAITAFVFPASVAGSRAASFAAPGIVYVVDRHPR